MIVVKVELWPGGDEESAREISRIGLANVSNLKRLSNYLAVIRDDSGSEIRKLVEGHPRAEGVEALIRRALEAVPIEAQPEWVQERFARELEELSAHMVGSDGP